MDIFLQNLGLIILVAASCASLVGLVALVAWLVNSSQATRSQFIRWMQLLVMSVGLGFYIYNSLATPAPQPTIPKPQQQVGNGNSQDPGAKPQLGVPFERGGMWCAYITPDRGMCSPDKSQLEEGLREYLQQ